MNEVISKATAARSHVPALASYSTKDRNDALLRIADTIQSEARAILEANEKDVNQARSRGQSSALIDRLTLTEERISGMVSSIKLLTELDDPTGKVLWETERPNGLKIKQLSVPLGVIGMIYEARPNVTIDASAMAIKTGNAILLRGSTSTIHSNKIIVALIQQALAASGFPEETVQLIEDPDRETANSLYTLKDLIDVLIPRGGKALIETVVAKSQVPVLETGAGNCHVYIDESADREMAINIVINAKTQRPSVCNACETVIIHEKWAQENLQEFVQRLEKNGVTLKGDDKTLSHHPHIEKAVEKDFEDEFLDLTLAVKIAGSLDEAIKHIALYGTKHSEAIISENAEHVSCFFNAVDASTLYHNASTRFTDGFEFGFGAEIGISTQKLHARGPMGLKTLTTTKYYVAGQGQTK